MLDDGALRLADFRHQGRGLLDLAVGQEGVVLALHLDQVVFGRRQLFVRLFDALAVLVLGQLLLQGFALGALLGQDFFVAVQRDA